MKFNSAFWVRKIPIQMLIIQFPSVWFWSLGSIFTSLFCCKTGPCHTQDFGLPVLLPSIPSNCRGKLLFTLGDDHSVEWTIITWPSMPCPIILKCFYTVYCALCAQLPNPETQGLHIGLSVIYHFQLWCFYSHLSVLSI